jgi:hypothetical protein
MITYDVDAENNKVEDEGDDVEDETLLGPLLTVVELH